MANQTKGIKFMTEKQLIKKGAYRCHEPEGWWTDVAMCGCSCEDPVPSERMVVDWKPIIHESNWAVNHTLRSAPKAPHAHQHCRLPQKGQISNKR